MSTPIPTSDLESSRRSSRPARPTKKVSSRNKITLGEFEIKKRLGQGGMGEVFLAYQTSLQRHVALKVLSKDLMKIKLCVDRFVHEARAMAKLHHPNIVSVYSVGSDKGRHYVAIEYIDGKSVQDQLDKHGAISIYDSVFIAKHCLYGLHHAHEKNMIHRDIKPDNILITSKGDVKLADFGLAKVLDEDLSMTKSGHGMGTPVYMPPEQARNAKYADKRSDLYAVGATLYHMLTNRIPFEAETAAEITIAKEKGQFKSARLVNSKIPSRLDLIVDKLLARNPDHRYQSCEEALKDLDSLNINVEGLSFIEGAEQPKMGMTRTARSLSSSGSKRSAVPVTSRMDAESSSKKEQDHALSEWYVRQVHENGRLQVAKLTTAQIQQAIKGGTLNPKSKAKQNTKQDFLPLAQYPEFASIVQSKVIQNQADKRSEQIKDVYSKIDKQDLRLKRWRWLSRLKEGVLGWFSLIIYLAIIAAIGYGLFLVLPGLYKMVANQFNL